MIGPFKQRLETYGYPGLVLVLILASWEAAGRFGLVAPYILPVPSAILQKLAIVHPILIRHTWITSVEIILGFFSALVTGVVLAMAVLYIRPFERAFYPWIIATQAIPKVAIGPLFIIWFGFGLFPKVLIACLIAFFPIMISTIIGLKSIELETLYLIRSMGAGKLKAFWYVRLPNALPHMFAGMKVAIVLASVGALVGEFVGASEGLGYVLLIANSTVDTELLFCALLIISLLAAGFYWAIHVLERVAIRWHVSVREDFVSATM